MARQRLASFLAFLLTFGLLAGAAPVAADPLPVDIPGVLGYRVVQVSADDLRRAAETGEPVSMDLGEGAVALRLERHQVFAPGAMHVLANGTLLPIDLGDFATLKGRVDGAPDSTVRLALRGDSVEGFVRIGLKTWNLQPLAGESHAVFRNDEVTMPQGLDLNHDTRSAAMASTMSVSAASTGMKNVKLAAFYDASFAAGRAYNVIAQDLAAAISGAEGIFDARDQYTFTIVMSNQVPESALPGCDSAEALSADLMPYVRSNYFEGTSMEFNMAHFWTGRDILAECGTSSYVYGYGSGLIAGDWQNRATSMTQIYDEPTGAFFPTSNSNHRRWTLAHEMGHIFDGNHCDATYTYSFGIAQTKTIMATWATLDSKTERTYPQCADHPADYWIFHADYVDAFSNDPAGTYPNNNVLRMQTAYGGQMPAPATPSQPTGPSGGSIGQTLTFQFTYGSPNWYMVTWGDGSKTIVDASNAPNAAGSFTLSHTYASEGLYDMAWAVRTKLYGPWSWSSLKPLSITNQAPTVSFSAPADGATVSGVVPVSGTAADAEGTLQAVQVRVDGGAWASAALSSGAWAYNWDSATVANGAHTLQARSFDGIKYSSVPTRTVTVSNGGGGGNPPPATIIQSDDGSAESQLDMNQADDEAVKRFSVTSSQLSGAVAAYVRVYAAVGQCTPGIDAFDVQVNGNTVGTLNPCAVWTADGPKDWRDINIPTTSLVAGTNSIRLEDARSAYTHTNVYFGIDTSTAGANSDIHDNNGPDRSGELMWRLRIEYAAGGTPTPALQQGFEGNLGTWTGSGLWHASVRRSVVGAYSAYYGQESTGNYDTGAANTGRLTSPSFVVPTNGVLTYKSWDRTESDASYDTKKVFISVDGGATWAIVDQVTTNAATWETRTVSLSAYYGATALLAFEFNTVDSAYNAEEGWYVDDVKVA